jgi:hypothetical protein
MKKEDKLLFDCQRAMKDIAHLMQGKVINAPLAQPLDIVNDQPDFNQFTRHYREFIQSVSLSYDARSRYWPVLAVPLIVVSLFPKADLHSNFMLLYLSACLTGFVSFWMDRFAGYSPGSILSIVLFSSVAQKEACFLANRYRRMIAQADFSMKGLMPLCYPHTRSTFFQSTIPHLMQHAINHALFSLDNDVYDCVSASALSILKLLDSGLYQHYKIERFYRISATRPDTHSFVVVNRTEGSVENLLSWNDDSILLCAWYKVCFTVKQLKANPELLEQYFLINPRGCETCEVNPKEAISLGYQLALREFKNKVASKNPDPGLGAVNGANC